MLKQHFVFNGFQIFFPLKCLRPLQNTPRLFFIRKPYNFGVQNSRMKVPLLWILRTLARLFENFLLELFSQPGYRYV